MRFLTVFLPFFSLASLSTGQAFCQGAAPALADVPPRGILIANPGSEADRSAIAVQNSPMDAKSVYGITIADSYKFADNIRSTVHLNDRNSRSIQHGASYGAYVYNQCRRGAPPFECNGVGLFSQAIAGIATAQNWPINTACNDNGYASACGNEHDVTVQSGSAIYTLWAGIIQGQVQPANANGIQLSQVPGAVAQWTYGFTTGDGAARNFGSVGALAASGSNIPSQPLWMNSFDRDGQTHAVNIQALDHALIVSDNRRHNRIRLSLEDGGIALGADGASQDVNVSLVPSGKGKVIMPSSLALADGSVWSAAGLTAATDLDMGAHAVRNLSAISSKPGTDLSLACQGTCSTYIASGSVTVLAVNGDGNTASPANPAARLGDARAPWAAAHMRQVQLAPMAFSELPSCSSAIQGTMAFITDSKQAITTWHQRITQGGGNHKAFVACNGSGWHAFDY